MSPRPAACHCCRSITLSWAGFAGSLGVLGPCAGAKHQSLNRSCSKLGTDPFIITPDARSGYQLSSLQTPHSYFLIYF